MHLVTSKPGQFYIEGHVCWIQCKHEMQINIETFDENFYKYNFFSLCKNETNLVFTVAINNNLFAFFTFEQLSISLLLLSECLAAVFSGFLPVSLSPSLWVTCEEFWNEH